MGFYKWLWRRGTAGQTVRHIAKLYHGFKKKSPQATDAEIYEEIIKFRAAVGQTAFPLTPHQRLRLQALLSFPKLTVARLASGIVFTEANTSPRDIGAKAYQNLMQVMQEEAVKCGIPAQFDDPDDPGWSEALKLFV